VRCHFVVRAPKDLEEGMNLGLKGSFEEKPNSLSINPKNQFLKLSPPGKFNQGPLRPPRIK